MRSGSQKDILAEPICMFGLNGVSGRTADASLPLATVRIGLPYARMSRFLVFRRVGLIEPLVKRWVKIR